MECLQVPHTGHTCSSLVHSVHGRLPQLRRGESRPFPALRLLRDAARGRTAAAGGAEDGHRRLLRPEGVDDPRRAARLGIAARGDDALLRGDARRARGARRPGREVHRRRRHGRLRDAEDPRGRRTPRRARGGRDEAAARRPERRARDPLGRHAREPHRREYGGGRGRRPDRRPAAGGRGHGQRRGPTRAGGDGERGARRRADIPARPQQRPGRGCGAARAERQGRARPRLSAALGRGGRYRAAAAAAAGRTRGRAGHPRRRVRRRGPCRHLPDGHDRRAGGRRQVTPDRGVLRPHRPDCDDPPRPLPPVRARHHVLAAGRDRPPGGRNRGRGRARRRAREDREPGRRCRGDRAGRSCGRSGRRRLPGPGALLGRAQAAGEHRLGAAARAQVRRHPLGRGDAARPDRAPPDDHRRRTAAPPVRDPAGSPRAARLARGLGRDRRAGAARRRGRQPRDRARPRDGRRAGRGSRADRRGSRGQPPLRRAARLDARRRAAPRSGRGRVARDERPVRRARPARVDRGASDRATRVAGRRPARRDRACVGDRAELHAPGPERARGRRRSPRGELAPDDAHPEATHPARPADLGGRLPVRAHPDPRRCVQPRAQAHARQPARAVRELGRAGQP